MKSGEIDLVSSEKGSSQCEKRRSADLFHLSLIFFGGKNKVRLLVSILGSFLGENKGDFLTTNKSSQCYRLIASFGSAKKNRPIDF